MSTPLHAIGPFALIHPSPASQEWAVVRVLKVGKRFTDVETLHADPADRFQFREVTAGLWHFPTEEAARSTRDGMFRARRAKTRATVRPENAGTRPRIRTVDGLASPTRLLCAGHGAYGYGSTPTEAYDNWQDSRHYILTTPHRNQPRYA